MRIIPLAAVLTIACGASLDLARGHGGTYRGPGDTVPPGGGGGGGTGGGPPTPGPTGPTGPGPGNPTTPRPGVTGPTGGARTGGKPGNPGTGGALDVGADLTHWSFWWGFNQGPYLDLKNRLLEAGTSTGSDDFDAGRGFVFGRDVVLAPSPETIRGTVVPALVAALENERDNDIVTGAMIALAKIGDVRSESGELPIQRLFRERLDDPSQEIAETAAVALGILGDPAAVPTLEHLLRDDEDGQRLVGTSEVSWRTRAFAAYGLGLIGTRVSDNATRQDIVRILADLLHAPRMSTRDVKVACLVALGLVPVDPLPGAPEDPDLPAHERAARSRAGQVASVLALLEREPTSGSDLLVAHAPRTLARLVDGAPELREPVVRALLAGCSTFSKRSEVVRQSCILALGQLGDLDEDPLDVAVRRELERNVRDGQNQERYFALIALAQVAGRPGSGAGESEAGLESVRRLFARQMAKGKSRLRPWAGLATGVLGRARGDAGRSASASLMRALRTQLAGCRSPQDVGAYAIACGLQRDVEAVEPLLAKLEAFADDEARGHVAIGLGLVGERSAIEPIQRVIAEAEYRPELMRQAAIALGLLGDKTVAQELVQRLRQTRSLSAQAAIAAALGFIGDARSIDPLVELLGDDGLPARARGFAAAALGGVADKGLLPWNTPIAVDINYRANTVTLTSPSDGTGILDFL